MKITIESTPQVVEVRTPQGLVPARVWVGRTESGIEVQCLVTRIAALKSLDLSQFDRELSECAAPSVEVPAYPLRMLL